jgi:DNA-binding GntR family transcriptional regulator
MSKLETYLSENKNQFDGNSDRLLREVAYDRIKDAVQNANLDPGEPLSEVQLSKMLGISRTPIREALHQLAKEGLLENTPGVVVAARSLGDLLDVLHLRLLLEPEMARLAAESAEETQLVMLDESVTRMEQAVRDDDYDGWTRADRVFHDVMHQACPNKLLGETVILMRSRVHHLASTDTRRSPARMAACTAEHRAVVDAIANRNAEVAEQAMRDHILKMRDSMIEKLKYS